MFIQIMKWVIRFAPIIGALESDVTKTITLVEADKATSKKLKDAIDGLLSVLEEIVGELK